MGMMIHRAKMRQVRQAMYEPKEEVKTEPKVIEAKEEEKEGEKEAKYTKEDINSLPFFSLKSVATSYGIDVKGKKAADLRADLIEKLEL